MRAPCSIEGCGKPSRGRGWCATHWGRWRRHGDPLFVKQRGVDWQVKPSCTVEDCDRLNHARGLCHMHYARWKKHGNPLHVEPITGRPPKGAHPSYGAIHKRLMRQRGPASRRSCVDCGDTAREWSYAGRSRHELVGHSGRFEIAYSLDLNDYEPRCTPCHRRHDVRQTKEITS